MSSVEGTIVEGRVIPDHPVHLPDGTRVRIEFSMSSPTPSDRESHLAALREGLAEIEAGQTVPAREALAELAAKYGLSSHREK